MLALSYVKKGCPESETWQDVSEPCSDIGAGGKDSMKNCNIKKRR